jgi:uncharacterized protein (TIGR00730 family)
MGSTAEIKKMKRVCVFCGSSRGNNPEYSSRARELGAILAREKLSLVYGGGGVGLMGELANSVMSGGGEVIGVIPEALEARELANRTITELRVVNSMHERKALMASLADAFIALPGGIGTLDEFSEIVTWAQLGIHHKPCGLLDIGNYYRNLIAFLDDAVREGFVHQDHRALVMIESDPERMVQRLLASRQPGRLDRAVQP